MRLSSLNLSQTSSDIPPPASDTKEIATVAPLYDTSEQAAAAMQWLFSEDSDPSPNDENLMRATMERWAERDPAAAQSWLRDNLDHPGVTPLIEGMIEKLTSEYPLVAMNWVNHIPTKERRANAWASASLPILFSDPDRAEDLLKQSSLDEVGKEIVKGEWNHAMARSQRNAQNIVSVIGAAKAAGTSIVPESVDALVEQLTNGITGAGTFADSVFKISPLSTVEVEMVKTFVFIEDTGTVRYRRPSDQ
ncbi:MAG: hypothetical protein ACI9R3_005085 [Verrucomicrobiales bacterium]